MSPLIRQKQLADGTTVYAITDVFKTVQSHESPNYLKAKIPQDKTVLIDKRRYAPLSEIKKITDHMELDLPLEFALSQYEEKKKQKEAYLAEPIFDPMGKKLWTIRMTESNWETVKAKAKMEDLPATRYISRKINELWDGVLNREPRKGCYDSKNDPFFSCVPDVFDELAWTMEDKEGWTKRTFYFEDYFQYATDLTIESCDKKDDGETVATYKLHIAKPHDRTAYLTFKMDEMQTSKAWKQLMKFYLDNTGDWIQKYPDDWNGEKQEEVNKLAIRPEYWTAHEDAGQLVKFEDGHKGWEKGDGKLEYYSHSGSYRTIRPKNPEDRWTFYELLKRYFDKSYDHEYFDFH